jgi:two-component system chemotaxis response regulator CheB
VPGHDIITIGTSAGGVEACYALARALPRDLAASVFVVLHVPPSADSHLPVILNRAGGLPASQAMDGEPIKRGRIYVATPDHHLMLEDGMMRVVRGPRENRHRPAVDPLFRSAALAYGPRVIGVVLTGALDDGTAGLLAIKRSGGIAVVQDPKDAYFPDMPASALEYVQVDYCVPLSAMGELLARLIQQPVRKEGGTRVPADMEKEEKLAEGDASALESAPRPGELAGFVCPECKGPLWKVRDGALVRFRCRVGHSFTADSMLAGQGEAVEDALWSALNILEESMQLSRQLADEARGRGHTQVARRLEDKAAAKLEQIETLRMVLLNGAVQAEESIPTAGNLPEEGTDEEAEAAGESATAS